VCDNRISMMYIIPIIWAKDRFALSRGHYHWRHEPVFYAVRKGQNARWAGGRRKDTVWRISGLGPADAQLVLAHLEENGGETTLWEIPVSVEDDSTGHSTQKPVECMRRPLLNNSRKGDAVYDPFVGSGSTVIAAETTGRQCYAMELSPQFCDVVVARWETFTGYSAKRGRR